MKNSDLMNLLIKRCEARKDLENLDCKARAEAKKYLNSLIPGLKFNDLYAQSEGIKFYAKVPDFSPSAKATAICYLNPYFYKKISFTYTIYDFISSNEENINCFDEAEFIDKYSKLNQILKTRRNFS